LEVGAQLKLIESPLDIADVVKKQWFPEGASAGDGDEPTATVSQRSWIFTSATLGSDDRLSWFLEGCGLQGLNERQLSVRRVSSPFNYEVQSALYVPSNFPKPNEPEHTDRVSEIALEATQGLGGRTLVLTTTLRALRQIGDTLTERLAESGITVLVQGQQSKRELIERFRAKDANSVLVASASFWEGVDIAGDALQCVIIDKLPFPPPGDPLVEARSKRLEAQGRSSFNDYSIPEAAIALKQGTGRLIRSEGDVGVLVVCDPRLVQMGYGRRLIASLPAMPILRTTESWREWLGLLRGISAGH
jgi:ATP-dependent DNA helicase DinG